MVGTNSIFTAQTINPMFSFIGILSHIKTHFQSCEEWKWTIVMIKSGKPMVTRAQNKKKNTSPGRRYCCYVVLNISAAALPIFSLSPTSSVSLCLWQQISQHRITGLPWPETPYCVCAAPLHLPTAAPHECVSTGEYVTAEMAQLNKQGQLREQVLHHRAPAFLHAARSLARSLCLVCVSCLSLR